MNLRPPAEPTDPGAARGVWLRGLRSVGRALGAVPRLAVGLLLAAWSLAIWNLSDRDIDLGPDSFWKSWLGNTAHAPLFGLWGLLLAATVAARPVPARWPDLGMPRRWLVLAGTLLFGLLDEWHQSHVPGREASLGDVSTDLVAVGCVLWVAAYLGRAEAEERGVRRRLLLGVTACLAAALLASLLG